MLYLSTAPVAAQVPGNVSWNVGPCTFASNVPVLGNATTTTVISGNQTYSGTYHVVGDLVFENGYVDVRPGTVFYIDGLGRSVPAKVTGRKLRLGKNAVFHAEQAQFRAACSFMWRGFELDPDVAGQRLELLDCQIGQAYVAVYVLPSSKVSHYQLERNVFYCNYQHVYDEGRHDGAAGGPGASTISYNLLYSDSQPMLAPFSNSGSGAANLIFTYEGLRLNALCPLDGATDVQVDHNLLHNALYGISNTVTKSADIDFEQNQLEGIQVVGYWLDEAPTSRLIGSVKLITNNVTTPQLSATTPAYGALLRRHTNPLLKVTVQGDGGQDTLTNQKRAQTGILVEDMAANLTGQTLTDLTYGISLRGTSQPVSVNTNVLSNCANGFRILPNPGVSANFALECNTIAPPALNGMRGLWIQSGAFLQDQGTASVPAGNKFVPASGGTFSKVTNDGTNGFFTYNRYNSSDELVLAIDGGTSGFVNNTGVTPTPGGTGNGCLGRGFSDVVGVNRGTGTLSSYVTALMDTVRRQAAPAERLRQYTAIIAREHLALGLTAALETYALSLPTANAAAYNELALPLLRHYTYESLDVAGAARVRAHLVSNGTADSRAWASYLAVVERLRTVRPGPGEALAAADSLALRHVALTGTGAAEPAAVLLRYYCPGLELLPTSERAAPAPAGLRRVAVEGQLTDLYPNPAGRRVQVAYALPKGVASAELRLSSLLTGNAVRTLPLAAGSRETTLELTGVTPGLYVCTLVVGGRPVSVQRLQVGHE
ncbi:hypothetical protein DLM85_05680 [Hymenobacter edaphi]|uniref:Secretion system C-terminal sorting domain-containing protein n=1 Tax=Hymenobacter edaphi TaxID=2211146 RepID=A0A328BWU7_9BACT|nr:hypothetical protein DLM85_05680 [Hymenobacter edaphi]